MKYAPFTIRHGSHPIPAIGPGQQLAALPKRTCPACGEVFLTRRARNDHMAAEHGSGGGEFAFMRACASEAIARRPDLQALWLADTNAEIATARELMGEERWSALQAEWFPKEANDVG